MSVELHHTAQKITHLNLVVKLEKETQGTRLSIIIIMA